MLIRFIVSNFKSFKDKTLFKPIAKNSYKRLQDEVYNMGMDLGILRASAIYGANASGKTNLFDAVQTLHSIVTKGSSEYKEIIHLPKFKINNNYLTKPTSFEIEFLKNENIYFYTLIIKDGRIISEKLVANPNINDQLIFERLLTDDNKIVLKINRNKINSAKERDKLLIDVLTELLTNTQPFLLEGYNRKMDELIEPFEWFSKNLHFIGTNHQDQPIINYIATDKFASIARSLIGAINLGISNIKVALTPIDEFFGESDKLKKSEIIEKFKDSLPFGINFERNKTIYNAFRKKDSESILIAKLIIEHTSVEETEKDIPFEFNEESLGTQKIFQLLPAIIGSVLEEKVFFIDEIESSIHSVLIYELLKIYLEAGSQYKGQLLFTTHECNLLDLDLIRQDAIWFTEKSNDGYTEIYSLSDFKPRFDKDIRKGYIQGKFTRIPFFTEPLTLEWNEK